MGISGDHHHFNMSVDMSMQKKATALHLLVMTNQRTVVVREKARAFRLWQSLIAESDSMTL